MTLLDQLKHSKWKYDNKIVNGLIISNRKRYGAVVPKSRYIIFMMMRRPVEWGVGRFVNMKRRRSLEMAYLSDDDIAMELYLLFDHCVDKYDGTTNLSIYYRSSIQRKIDKIIYSRSSEERSFSGMTDNVEQGAVGRGQDDGMNEEKLDILSVHGIANYNAFYDEIDRMGFTDEEKSFLAHRLSNERVTDVMSEAGIKRNEYKDLMSRVAKKLIKHGYNGGR